MIIELYTCEAYALHFIIKLICEELHFYTCAYIKSLIRQGVYSIHGRNTIVSNAIMNVVYIHGVQYTCTLSWASNIILIITHQCNTAHQLIKELIQNWPQFVIVLVLFFSIALWVPVNMKKLAWPSLGKITTLRYLLFVYYILCMVYCLTVSTENFSLWKHDSLTIFKIKSLGYDWKTVSNKITHILTCACIYGSVRAAKFLYPLVKAMRRRNLNWVLYVDI